MVMYMNPSEIKWGDAPPVLPKGAKMAVLSGDPTKSVPYAVRLKFPANYAIPAHSHPTDENVVVGWSLVISPRGNMLAYAPPPPVSHPNPPCFTYAANVFTLPAWLM